MRKLNANELVTLCDKGLCPFCEKPSFTVILKKKGSTNVRCAHCDTRMHVFQIFNMRSGQVDWSHIRQIAPISQNHLIPNRRPGTWLTKYASGWINWLEFLRNSRVCYKWLVNIGIVDVFAIIMVAMMNTSLFFLALTGNLSDFSRKPNRE